MTGQLKHQKRRGEQVQVNFNIHSAQGVQGSQPSVSLTSVWNNDDGENLWLPFEMSVAEARHLSNRLMEAAARAAEPRKAA